MYYNILDQFLRDCGIENNGIKDAKAEYIEVASNENTNFDFWIETRNNVQIFFEIKYTEDGFAKHTGARNKDRLWNEIYQPLCNDSINLKNANKEDFLDRHFQLYRNIVRARKASGNYKESYVVFLTMKSNPSTHKELVEVVESEDYKQVCVVYWEDIVRKILQYPVEDKCKEYFREFQVKYLDYDN